ncbi:formyltransferase, partial [Burkholderia sp. SIMBA_042]
GSYFSGRRPEDGRIDWRQPASAVYNLIRAVAPPYPGAFTELAGHRLIVAAARRLPALPSTAALPPGLHVADDRIVAVCGDGGLLHIRTLLEG